jgi:hypothetical protein
MTHRCTSTLGFRVYEITADAGASDSEVWEYAQTFHSVSFRHEPHERFPTELSMHASLVQINATTWRYMVTEPDTN